MGQLVTCPPASQIADVVVSSCPVDIGQVQKLIFQRRFSSGTTRNSMTVTDAALLATWTARLTATGNTKVQVSPFINGPTFEPGDVIEFGSGNDVVDGIPLAMGKDPSNFTANLFRISSASKASLKLLEGEELGVYFIDEHGRIWGDVDDAATPTTLYPMSIREFAIGDRKVGGKVEPDTNVIKFKFPPGWDDSIGSVTPSDFDALSGLAGS